MVCFSIVLEEGWEVLVNPVLYVSLLQRHSAQYKNFAYIFIEYEILICKIYDKIYNLI